jgi:protein ImuB
MLWLALHLPLLPIEVFLRGHADTPDDSGPAVPPFAVAEGHPPRRILLPDRKALHSGVQAGMGVSAAYGMAPDLLVRSRDAVQETAALEALALWSEQFTPIVHVAEPDALLLEIGGCLRLFEGLDNLTSRVREGLVGLGFTAALACAPTPTGALLFARHGLETMFTDLPTLREHLARLPLDGLDMPPATLTALRDMGVRTLGECQRLPRDGLTRRFGPALLVTLDRAFGHRPDPRAPFVPPPHFRSRLTLPVPVPDMEPLLFGARRLVGELTGFLTGRGAGVMRFLFQLEHDGRPATRVAIELSMPSRDAVHLGTLVRERFSRTVLPAPVEALVLDCEETMQLAPRNFSLFASDEVGTEQRTALVERLRARLGREAIHGLALVPEHRPELAFREAEPGTMSTTGGADAAGTTGTAGVVSAAATSMPRPLWLLARPEPVAAAALTCLSGPERIESGWWDGRDARRDYFIAQQRTGALVWAYREHATDDSAAKWYVHGFFA